MFCTQCGSEVSERANFCRRCGKKIRARSKPNYQNNISTSEMLNKAKTKISNFANPKIERSKETVLNTIDNISEKVNNPHKLTQLSSNQRDFLAQRLASLRLKISKNEQSNFEPSIEEAHEIVELNEELLKQLENDKCLICYKNLKSEDKKEELVICPQCGHGGHKNHIYSWYESQSSCPYCKTTITKDQVLILKY